MPQKLYIQTSNILPHTTKTVNMNKYYAVFDFVMQEFKSSKTLFGSI